MTEEVISDTLIIGNANTENESLEMLKKEEEDREGDGCVVLYEGERPETAVPQGQTCRPATGFLLQRISVPPVQFV